MTDRAAFLAAVRAAPDDDTARLVFADWLDESGDPQGACDQRLAALTRAVCAAPADDGPRLAYAAVCDQYGRHDRAEFIRIQLATDARFFGGCARERELLDALHPTGLCRNQTAWAGPAASLARYGDPAPYTFSRGFVSGITCRAGDWVRHADAIAWRPGRRRGCPWCNGQKVVGALARPTRYVPCPACRGAGDTPVPFAPTAMPVERVRLTGWSDPGLWRAYFGPRDDAGRLVSDLIRETWPGIVFDLPSAFDRASGGFASAGLELLRIDVVLAGASAALFDTTPAAVTVVSESGPPAARDLIGFAECRCGRAEVDYTLGRYAAVDPAFVTPAVPVELVRRPGLLTDRGGVAYQWAAGRCGGCGRVYATARAVGVRTG